MNGILWKSKTRETDMSFFKNYKFSLMNLFDSELYEVDNKGELSDINNLFVIDEHFLPHKEFLTDLSTIQKINKHNVNVIIFNTEKIFNSYWPHNQKIQKKLSKINSMVQILSDVNDIKKLGTPFKNKQYLSKEFKFNNNLSRKKNKILFYGQLDGGVYKNRRIIINNFQKMFGDNLEVIKSTRDKSYREYINLLSSFQYILNPLGAGEFINIRYFEALAVNSIPIQEITNVMRDYYIEEISSNNSVFFSNTTELENFKLNEMKNYNFSNPFYLEDYLFVNNLISFLRQ